MAASNAAPTDSQEPEAWMLPGVKLFASGVYRGKRWEAKTIDNIARCAKSLGPNGKKLIVPPSVLGHEEEQEWLERTDLPAAGWVDPDSVRSIPDPDNPGEKILVGDIVNIPDIVKREKLDSGEYRFGSAEIYDDFKDDFGNSYGKALRRFSILGGEVPQVKRLGTLPKPVPMQRMKTFAENAKRVILRERVIRLGGKYHVYAETRTVDKSQMIAALKQAMPGISQATLDAMNDDQLADLVKNLPSPAPTTPTQPASPPSMGASMNTMNFADLSPEEMVEDLVEMGAGTAEELSALPPEELAAMYDEMTGADSEGGTETETMGDPATMSREEIIAELVAAGQDAAALESMSDEELRAMYAEVVGGATASAPAETVAGAGAPPMTPMSERRRNNRQTRFSEKQLARRAAQVDAALAGELRKLKAANYQNKKKDAELFCEQLVREGRVTPSQVKTLVLGALLAADNEKRVHKYSENGVTRALTAYERKKAELAQLPVVIRHGERLPKAVGAQADAADVAKVRNFATTLSASALKAGGYSSADNFVEKFSELKKKRPSLTAEEYLGS